MPLKMQYLVKQVQELVVLMLDLDLVIWQDLLVKEKQKKFGFYVENIIQGSIKMGLINAITKIEELEAEGVIWAERFYEIVQLLFVFLKLHSMRRMMGLRVFKNYLDTQLNYFIRLKKLKKVEMPF